MKKLLALFALSLAAAVPVQAATLDEALKALDLSNEQVIANIPEDRLVADVVSRIEAGAQVPEAEVRRAYDYSASMFEPIKTPKLRQKMLDTMMKEVDKALEAWAWKGGSDDRYFQARRKSSTIRRRLRSLIEFEAERYQRFLKVLVDDC